MDQHCRHVGNSSYDVASMLACRMNPQVPHGQMVAITSNPFALQPVLVNHAYQLTTWQTLIDKDIIRTFVVAPYIKDEVSFSGFSSSSLLAGS